jgi:uncharacterized protein YggE
VKTQLFALILVAATLPVCAQQISISKENKTIAISTTGEASTLADTAILSVGFATYGKDQDSTYADASHTSNAIVDALTNSGVPKDAIQSSSQNLTAINPGNNEDKARYLQGLRFELTQNWHITVPAEQAAKALHIAINGGANESGSIDWQLQHDDALQAEAAQNALKHAREVAERMAQGLGSKLGALVYASNQTPARGFLAALNPGFGNVSLDTQNSSAMASKSRNLKPLAISPERITKTATVYAVFAIE